MSRQNPLIYAVPMCICAGTLFVVKPGRMLIQSIMNIVKPSRRYLVRKMHDKIRRTKPQRPFMVGSSTIRRIAKNVIANMFFEDAAVDWSGTSSLAIVSNEISHKMPTLVVCYCGVNDLGELLPSSIVSNIVAISNTLMIAEINRIFTFGFIKQDLSTTGMKRHSSQFPKS